MSYKQASRPGAKGQQKRRPSTSNIHPSKFVKVAQAVQQQDYQPKHAFADFALDARIKQNLVAKGYQTPSPIQDQAIPIALNGRDVIGVAGTGTGKTAAFMLPILQRLLENGRSSVLVIAPTRELAEQIRSESRSFAKGLPRVYDTLLIGGKAMGGQLKDLARRPRIVIGTPGRIKDHIERGSLKLQYFDQVVLDEVDRMLDMGFVKDVTLILSHLNPQRQSFFFSATLDARVRQLIGQFANDPETVAITSNTTSENVHQDVIRVGDRQEKLQKLNDILNQAEVEKAIVFHETQRSVERLSRQLIERGVSAASIHGGKTQGQRQRALDQFKRGEIAVLVATDVAARGIDVADVTHVINFTAPKEYQDYIHRIGRAGRAGKIGHALTFIESDTTQR